MRLTSARRIVNPAIPGYFKGKRHYHTLIGATFFSFAWSSESEARRCVNPLTRLNADGTICRPQAKDLVWMPIAILNTPDEYDCVTCVTIFLLGTSTILSNDGVNNR